MRIAVRAAALLATTSAAVSLTLPAYAVRGDSPGQPAARSTVATGAHLTWRHRDIDTTQRLRGLAAVSRRTAWVTGDQGGVWRTRDGGHSWRDVSPPQAVGLNLRDVESTSAKKAVVLAIGQGSDSRIFRTVNGGRTWATTFVNTDAAAFFDAIAMWPDGRHGLAMSDPVRGKFRLVSTNDGGRSWHRVSGRGMPPAVDGEFGFAASGTCLVAVGTKTAYLASGGAAARVFVSHDRGRTWFVRTSTLPSDAVDGAGVFSLAFRTPRVGLAVGGNLGDPTDGAGFAARTLSGGRHWHNVGDLGGYRSGVDWRWAGRRTAIAVGPTGSDVTRDAGRTWRTFDAGSLDAVQCVHGVCWASGDLGAVAKLVRVP